MEAFSADIIKILEYLLPGFVTAWIFYGLTSFPKPSQFERVVQALIFNVFVQAFVFLARYCLVEKFKIFYWNENSHLICSFIFSIVLGIMFSYFANFDVFHKKLRDWGITRQTSYPSEWFGLFLKNITFVVLHLEGDRRIYGWPIEWPSEPDKGHFALMDACWLTDENKEIPLETVELIMIDVKEVKMVEFMKKLKGAKK